jgi:hypothetical protein
MDGVPVVRGDWRFAVVLAGLGVAVVGLSLAQPSGFVGEEFTSLAEAEAALAENTVRAISLVLAGITANLFFLLYFGGLALKVFRSGTAPPPGWWTPCTARVRKDSEARVIAWGGLAIALLFLLRCVSLTTSLIALLGSRQS